MRAKQTLLVLISKMLSGILPGLISIFLNILVISKYGSDVNGLVSTIAQFTGVLSIFEGGFTLATNVALYKPFINNEIDKINEILTASRIIYNRIGILSSIFVLILAFFSAFTIQTSVEWYLVIALVLISTSSIIFHFFYFARINIMFYVSQKEYILEFTLLIFNLASQILSIVLVLNGVDFLRFKFIGVIVLLLRLPIIRYFQKKYFPYANFYSENPNFIAIKSTLHVFIQNLTSALFSSSDLMIIASLLNTKMASVFAVYSFIYAFIKSILMAVIQAPFNAFGQIQSRNSDEKSKISQYVKIYQFVSMVLTTIILIAVNLVILPFIQIYTRNIHDIEYVNSTTALLFSLVTFLEMYLNVFGTIANTGGHFIEMRNISVFGVIIHLVLSIFLIKIIGVNGILFGKFIAYFVMLVLQAYLVYTKIVVRNYWTFIKILLPNLFVIILVFILTFNRVIISDYYEFIFAGISGGVCSIFLVILINGIINRSVFMYTMKFILSMKVKI